MTFISVLIALVIEQFRPLSLHNPVYALLDAAVCWLERHMNAGERRHGVYAWWVLIGSAVVVVAGVHILLLALGWEFALVYSIAILYLTLGFRQFSHPFTEIQLALDAGQLNQARTTLAQWMVVTYPEFSAERLSAGEVARYAIERALMLSHRHVFGVFFWYLLFGPTGAVVYRLADYAARTWEREAPGDFSGFSVTAWRWMDWIPVRLTGIGFAIVGNFEDAMYAWRNFASRWRDPLAGIVLASGGGALGVRLGGGRDNPLEQTAMPVNAAALDAQAAFDAQPGVEVEPAHLRSAVGLVWRAMVLWLLLLLLISIAHWIG